MQPSSKPAQASARTLLEAYIIDYLRRAGCEDLARTAGERWQVNADVPVPRTRNGILLDWWVRFWKQELRRQREAAAQAERDLARHAQASSPDPPSSESNLEPCAATGPDQRHSPRTAALCSSHERLSVSHGVCSPSPRLPSLRVDSGQTSLHDSGCSPLVGSSGATASQAAMTRATASAERRPTGQPAQQPEVPAVVAVFRRALASHGDQLPCSPSGEVSDAAQTTVRGWRQASAPSPASRRPSSQQQQQQLAPPIRHTGSALWDDEVLDNEPHLALSPGSPAAMSGDKDYYGRDRRRAAYVGGAAMEGRGSCRPADLHSAQQHWEAGKAALHRCMSTPVKPRHVLGADGLLASPRAALHPTPPRLHDAASPHDGEPTDAEADSEYDDEDGGGGSLQRQRSVRPRPQPGAYARLAQERMRTNVRRIRQPGEPRLVGAVRGRRATAGEGTAQVQHRRRQQLLQRRRQQHAAQQQHHQQQQQGALATEQVLRKLEEACGSGSLAIAPELGDFPDIPEDLLALGDAGCFESLFGGPGGDMGMVGWELPGTGCGAPGVGAGAGAGLGPCISEGDLGGMFDDPLDVLLPLPEGAANVLSW